ncbi:MAG TPA: MBL fold metallo-hydrolase RNA specificity domain-containing protein, partial [Candidatus Goldiibacteriota bacterium]|nr:MBL fold metallo-hydrolase RNA specificity domain-containing protein [Candidatus Goldiibacteriota bacterium]
AGDVCFIDPKISVYLGHGTKALNDVFNKIYSNFKMELNGNEKEFKTGDEIKIKDVGVIPMHVDHSIPGAYGFIIKTPEGNIAYTGDFRFHGFKPQLTEDFMIAASKAKVKILITEGTRIKKQTDKVFKQNLTESDVENNLYEVIKRTDGITFVNFSFRNVDRVRSLCNATKRAGKILVANPGFFYTVDNAGSLITGMPKTSGNKCYKVFKKDGDIPDEEKRIRDYAKPYFEKSIDYKWVRKNIGDVVMFVTSSEFIQMIDIQPKSGTFIFSISEHYLEGEENEEYKLCLENWLHHFGIKFEQIHCSGHADGEGVKRMVETINPEIVIPVHTEAPEEFKRFCKKVVLPEKEKNNFIMIIWDLL